MTRNISLLACAFVMLVGAGATAIPTLTSHEPIVNELSRTARFDVRGMTCAGCALAVRMAARKIDGVTDVSVSYEHKRATVTFDPAKTTPEAIAKAITEDFGFGAEPTRDR